MKVTSFLKATAFRLIGMLLGIVFGLIVGEIACRFYYFGSDAFNFSKVNSFITIGYTGYIQRAEDQYVWYELKPNIEGLFKMKPFQTNSLGLRDKEYSLEKPANTFRVAVIGDSFTLGDGVSESEIYHSILEEKLNAQSEKTKFEFINFGLGGYDLLNYLGVIQAKALAYNPDLILIGFCGNNDDDLADPRQWNEPFTGYKLQEYSWIIKRMLLLRTAGALISIHRRMNNEIADSRRAAKIAFVKEMFAAFGEIQKETKIPFLVTYLSMADAAKEKAILVGKQCQQNGFEFIDTSLKVDSISDISKYWIHSTDHHPNAEMHRIYAEEIGTYFNQYVPNPINKFKDKNLKRTFYSSSTNLK